ncbi:MAG TPA: diguanylate cyclase [Candidatus Acidoferrales bacterium]|nr:diguanylate cyclase [Candidatus Acidoferrales bacterium]
MKVLVADDEVVSRRLIETSVRRWGYEVIVASDGIEAARILQQPDAPKLAVLDWMMPGLDGVQLCRQLRQQNSNPYTYILLLTAKQTQRDVVNGLEAGADDYITKPFDPQELRVRLRTGKRILFLLDQLTTTREALRQLAARDPLTSLWNHNSIIELLSGEIQRAQRQGTCVGLVLADLDKFKVVNDTYGHLVGDHVLRQTATALTNTIRPYDAAGRLGGEEFLVILPGCDQMNSISHAERLRVALHRMEVSTPMETRLRLSASFGVTVIGPDEYWDADMAIHIADTAMYAAKYAGRDRVEFASSTSVLLPA